MRHKNSLPHKTNGNYHPCFPNLSLLYAKKKLSPHQNNHREDHPKNPTRATLESAKPQSFQGAFRRTRGERHTTPACLGQSNQLTHSRLRGDAQPQARGSGDPHATVRRLPRRHAPSHPPPPPPRGAEKGPARRGKRRRLD